MTWNWTGPYGDWREREDANVRTKAESARETAERNAAALRAELAERAAMYNLEFPSCS